MTRHRVDGRTPWHIAAPWIALVAVALLVLVTLLSEAAWR